jgi:hypothetical protein
MGLLVAAAVTAFEVQSTREHAKTVHIHLRHGMASVLVC